MSEIKAGDRVTIYKYTEPTTVRAIYGDNAWVDYKSRFDGGSIVPLSSCKPYPPSTPPIVSA